MPWRANASRRVPRPPLTPRGLLGSAALLGGLSAAYAWRESKRVERTRTVIQLHELPPGLDGLRILHISDTHFPANGESVPRFLRAVAAQDYDIVFATGDYVESQRGWPVVVEAFRRISPQLGMYAVLGGHDRYAGVRSLGDVGRQARRWRRRPRLVDPTPLVQGLQAVGVQVLLNQSRAVEIGGEVVRLIGIDDAYLGLDDLAAALPEDDAEELPGFRVLLSHSPDGVSSPLAASIPLALCGHTHGGQIRIPFYGAPVRHAQAVDRKRPAGLMRIGATTVYVSRGFGTATIPLRFACRPELGVVELRRLEPQQRGQRLENRSH